MTCKDCLHHEAMRPDAFYCEAYNDLFVEDDVEGAENCNQFKQTEDKGADEP